LHLTGARWGWILIWLLMLPLGVAPLAGEWSVKAGLGYEYLNQEYFLDSLSFGIEDTLAAATALSTTYLDDLKGELALTFRPTNDRTCELRTSYEQTAHQLRLKSAADFHPKLGSGRLDGTAELDWRHSLDDTVAAGDEYLYGYTRAKYMLPIREHVSLFWQLRAEFVDFDSTGSYAFDHYRAGGSFGLRREFGGLSSLDVSGFVMGRDVPDSARLSYLSYGLESSLFTFYDRGDLDALLRGEVRDYNSIGEDDDYLRAELTARHRLDLGYPWFTRQETEIEGTWFDEPDDLSGDYGRYRLAVLAGVDNQIVSFALGPQFELLWQKGDAAFAEDYTEIGLNTQLDVMKVSLLFASVESVLGQRNVQDEGGEDALRSDFVFERLNILADLTIVPGLSLNALVSAEWEWHDQEDENSRLILVSTGLSYTF